MKVLQKIKEFYGVKKSKYPQRVVLQHPNGSMVHFMVHNPVEDYRITRYGDEKEFFERFIVELKNDDILYDIGASVGLMTIHASVSLQDGKVVSFEPDSETRNCLNHNIELNNLSNVEVVSWAVSDRKGKAVLFSDGSSGRAPTLREQQSRLNAPKGRIDIETGTIDEAIKSGILPLPTLLKIDIEGAEILCIKGCRRLLYGELGNSPRKIFLEMHPDFLPDFDSSEEEVQNLILEAGYNICWSLQRQAQAHYCYEKA